MSKSSFAKNEERGVSKRMRKKTINSYIGGGIMRYSKTQVYKKKCLYRFKKAVGPIVKKHECPIKKIKKIGGEKNGEERIVFLKKPKSNYPTKNRIRKSITRGTFNRHVRYIRKPLKPGRILILLAGRHRGKRVVLLKVLKSGLLLVTGPLKVNACPLRRISQRYVIACQTRLDLGNYEVPVHIDDKYFKRTKSRVSGGDIFATKKKRFLPSEERKMDQTAVDNEIYKAIKKRDDSKLLVKYLKNMFCLRSSQYPHRMKF